MLTENNFKNHFVPYLTFPDNITMDHDLNNDFSKTLVHFKQIGHGKFKECYIYLDSLEVKENDGFTGENLYNFIKLIKANRDYIKELIPLGGIQNA